MSDWYGRAQPFGQPVIRTLIGSAARPSEMSVGSSWSITPGSARSLSVIASGQVGMAGQAMLHLRTAERDSAWLDAVLGQDRIDPAAPVGRDVAQQHVLLGAQRTLHRTSATTARTPARRRNAPASFTRPLRSPGGRGIRSPVRM